jgi:hypothetical protein
MVRVNKAGRRGKYNNAHTGTFTPLHPEKFKGKYKPVYKSALELKFMRYCDRNPKIVLWDYEGLHIKYLDKAEKPEKVRNYHIDFVIYAKVGDEVKKMWVEIKQSSETKKPVNESDVRGWKTWIKNQCKWRQAAITARNNNANFKVITEEQLD